LTNTYSRDIIFLGAMQQLLSVSTQAATMLLKDVLIEEIGIILWFPFLRG
jgi:hypothetical protein